jgi:predicted amidohydrolase YtcJ
MGKWEGSRHGHFLLTAAVVVIAGVFSAAEQPADVIVTHARIYTVNAKQTWAEALAVRGEKIVAVGTEQDIAPYRGTSTKVMDAGGRLVLPGFTDCHVHFVDGSIGLTQVDLNDADSVAEIQKRVKEYAETHPKTPWITGMGWTYPTFGAAALPNKKILDDIVPDRPVFLVAFDGHSSWANSKALAMAKIDRNTPDPANGKIVRDANGDPTGALKESAGDLVSKLMPKPTRTERLTALRKGLHEANRLGVVRVHSAGGDFQYLDLLDELRRNGQLSVRFYVAYFLDPPGLTPEITDKIEKAHAEYHDEWLSGGAVKTMLDGVVEAHTAAMLAPYSDDLSQSGKLFWDEAKYKETVQELDRRGLQIFTHAIGDRAVRLALDAYENAATVNRTNDARPRIEHIETISAADVSRFGKLGVIASMQPLHANPDEDTLGIWARNIGKERAQRAWVWRSIEQSGGKLAFGSDWPVVTISPWPGVQDAVTRQTQKGTPQEGFVPQQRLGLEDTIHAYTLGAAFAGHRENNEGSLEPGKLADLIVLSQDLFKIEPSAIVKTKVMMTMVGGKVVYKAPGWNATKSGVEKN